MFRAEARGKLSVRTAATRCWALQESMPGEAALPASCAMAGANAASNASRRARSSAGKRAAAGQRSSLASSASWSDGAVGLCEPPAAAALWQRNWGCVAAHTNGR